MTKAWITANLPIDNDGNVILQQITPEITITISIDDLASLTASVPDPPTHAALSALPIAAAGWQPIFDQWLADGIIQ